MQTGTGLVYRHPLTRFSRSLRCWLVSCAATSRTTLRSSLLTQHFTMSGSLLSRFAACCAAPARLGRSLGSIAPVTGPVPRWRRWREWTLRLAGLSFEDGVEIEGVGEVDLVIEGWVVVELDGYTYHCDEYQFGLDRWRDRRLVARGFLPLRFTRKDVYAHQVVPDVQRALERWGVSKSVTKAATGTERAR